MGSHSGGADPEQAWPQSSGEEDLQLQLALAMSKEEAEQVTYSSLSEGGRGGSYLYLAMNSDGNRQTMCHEEHIYRFHTQKPLEQLSNNSFEKLNCKLTWQFKKKTQSLDKVTRCLSNTS